MGQVGTTIWRHHEHAAYPSTLTLHTMPLREELTGRTTTTTSADSSNHLQVKSTNAQCESVHECRFPLHNSRLVGQQSDPPTRYILWTRENLRDVSSDMAISRVRHDMKRSRSTAFNIWREYEVFDGKRPAAKVRKCISKKGKQQIYKPQCKRFWFGSCVLI